MLGVLAERDGWRLPLKRRAFGFYQINNEEITIRRRKAHSADTFLYLLCRTDCRASGIVTRSEEGLVMRRYNVSPWVLRLAGAMTIVAALSGCIIAP